MGHVYYHHPADKQFSLDFANPVPENLVSQIVDYDGDVAVKVMEYELDTDFYVVYTSRVGSGAVSDIELNLSDALAEMTEDNGTIVARLLEIYRALLSQNEEEGGTPVEAYKNIHVDALPEAFDETSWEGTATDVGGRLASNLILKHALPNANHRAAVARACHRKPPKRGRRVWKLCPAVPTPCKTKLRSTSSLMQRLPRRFRCLSISTSSFC